MTLEWLNNIANPAGLYGDDYKVLRVSGADGTSSVQITTQKYPPGGAMVFSIWWGATNSTTVDLTILGQQETGAIDQTWKRKYWSVSSPSGQTILITPPAGAPDIYLCMAQLEMGEFPSDWREGQEDFATKTEFNITNGQVQTLVATVDSVVRETATPGNYQVFVSGGNSLVAENNGTTVMELTPGMFSVSTNVIELNAPDESLRVDANGASMDNLTVNNKLIAPNVAQTYTGKSTIYVGSSATDHSTYDAYRSLQDAFEALNYKIIQDQDVTILVQETQYGECSLKGIMGSGSVRITSSTGVTINGNLYISSCILPIIVFRMNVVFDPASGVSQGKHAVRISGCNSVILGQCDITTSSSNRYCVYIENGATVDIQSTSMYSWSYGRLIYSGNGCHLICNDVSGGESTSLFLNAFASTIMWSGTRPNGDYMDDDRCLFVPDDILALTKAPDTTPPQPVNPPQQYKTTLTATDSASARSSDGWVSNVRWQNEAYIRQGAGDTDQYLGMAWFDTSELPSGTKTVKSVTLKIKRNSDAGSTSDVSVTIYSNMVTKNSGNPHTGISNQIQIGTMLRGQETEYSATGTNLLAIAQALVNGTANAIVFYASDSPTGRSGRYSTNWARFDGVGESSVPTLEIVYELTT